MGEPAGHRGQALLAHQRGIDCRSSRRHQDDALDLAHGQLLDRVLRQRGGGLHAVDDGLQHAEPMQLELALEIAGQRVAGQMQEQAGGGLRPPRRCARPAPAPCRLPSPPSRSPARAPRPPSPGRRRTAAACAPRRAADATSRRAARCGWWRSAPARRRGRSASASSNETLSSGSTVASCPCSSSAALSLSASGSGRVTRRRIRLSARKKSGPALASSSAAASSASGERLLGAAFAAGRVALAAVGREDHAAEDEAAAGELGEAGNRRAAGAVELGEEGALGGDGKRGRLMVDGREQLRPSRRRRRGSRRRWRPAPRPAASPRSAPAR